MTSFALNPLQLFTTNNYKWERRATTMVWSDSGVPQKLVQGAMHIAVSRRQLLASTAVVALTGAPVDYIYRGGGLPQEPDDMSPPVDVSPPAAVRPGPWLYFFTAGEAVAVEAIVDRLIPPDKSGPGGKEAGCAVFIDQQLAGAFGNSKRLFMSPPFADGTPSQGLQSPIVPKERYRLSLAKLDVYCRTNFAGKAFAALSLAQQDQILTGLENGEIALQDRSGKAFFEQVLADTIDGFFADPIYGGNRDMAGWKLIGFPGARYDYRDHVSKHNEPYPLPPVSILGANDWSVPD